MSINDELTARATKLRVAVADVAARSSRHGTAPSDRPVSYLPPLQAAPSRRSTAGQARATARTLYLEDGQATQAT